MLDTRSRRCNNKQLVSEKDGVSFVTEMRKSHEVEKELRQKAEIPKLDSHMRNSFGVKREILQRESQRKSVMHESETCKNHLEQSDLIQTKNREIEDRFESLQGISNRVQAEKSTVYLPALDSNKKYHSQILSINMPQQILSNMSAKGEKSLRYYSASEKNNIIRPIQSNMSTDQLAQQKDDSLFINLLQKDSNNSLSPKKDIIGNSLSDRYNRSSVLTKNHDKESTNYQKARQKLQVGSTEKSDKNIKSGVTSFQLFNDFIQDKNIIDTLSAKYLSKKIETLKDKVLAKENLTKKLNVQNQVSSSLDNSKDRMSYVEGGSGKDIGKFFNFKRFLTNDIQRQSPIKVTQTITNSNIISGAVNSNTSRLGSAGQQSLSKGNLMEDVGISKELYELNKLKHIKYGYDKYDKGYNNQIESLKTIMARKKQEYQNEMEADQLIDEIHQQYQEIEESMEEEQIRYYKKIKKRQMSNAVGHPALKKIDNSASLMKPIKHIHQKPSDVNHMKGIFDTYSKQQKLVKLSNGRRNSVNASRPDLIQMLKFGHSNTGITADGENTTGVPTGKNSMTQDSIPADALLLRFLQKQSHNRENMLRSASLRRSMSNDVSDKSQKEKEGYIIENGKELNPIKSGTNDNNNNYMKDRRLKRELEQKKINDMKKNTISKQNSNDNNYIKDRRLKRELEQKKISDMRKSTLQNSNDIMIAASHPNSYDKIPVFSTKPSAVLNINVRNLSTAVSDFNQFDINIDKKYRNNESLKCQRIQQTNSIDQITKMLGHNNVGEQRESIRKQLMANSESDKKQLGHRSTKSINLQPNPRQSIIRLCNIDNL